MLLGPFARRTVLQWGQSNLRPLPWRGTRDPWAILVSEVMAQQTQVDRVVPRWAAFLDRWPDPGALAAEPLGELLACWSGLGYPRRARDLHATARRIVEVHGGQVPAELGALLALPGIGAYTARAVLVFAFEQPQGVVDTNVARVLARVGGRSLNARAAQATADAMVPSTDPWAWNQSIMEIGALLCRPVPRCGECPLSPSCAWHRAGCPDPDPADGSAGVSRAQAPYEGSDRQARGRLLAAVLVGPLPTADVAVVAGLPDDEARAAGVLESLVDDGLVVRGADGRWAAP